METQGETEGRPGAEDHRGSPFGPSRVASGLNSAGPSQVRSRLLHSSIPSTSSSICPCVRCPTRRRHFARCGVASKCIVHLTPCGRTGLSFIEPLYTRQRRRKAFDEVRASSSKGLDYLPADRVNKVRTPLTRRVHVLSRAPFLSLSRFLRQGQHRSEIPYPHLLKTALQEAISHSKQAAFLSIPSCLCFVFRAANFGTIYPFLSLSQRFARWPIPNPIPLHLLHLPM